ncbi:MAG: hypothetical protein P9L99_07650 [Candidatus Lernaella stagnicola]|nr:hypothetical protein [Candidatus Lernaella stagnicola]
MKWKLRCLMLLMLLAVVAVSVGCLDDDDDDDVDGDDDNDVAADDDDDDDNDDNDDNDDDDNDTTDDDDDNDDNDTAPAGLMLIDNRDVYQQTAAGWTRETMPDPYDEPALSWYPGPTLMINGDHVIGVWNAVSVEVQQPWWGEWMSKGYTWMEWTPDTGWFLNDEPPTTGENHQATFYGLSAGDLWVLAETYHLTSGTIGFSWERTESLFEYEDNEPIVRQDFYLNTRTTAMESADDGRLVLARTGYWLYFDGVQWREYDNPPGFVDEIISNIVFGEGDDLFVSVYEADHSRIAHWDGEQWEVLPLPEGCPTDFFFDQLRGSSSHMVAFDFYNNLYNAPSAQSHFLEYRAGQWACREMEIDDPRPRIFDGIVLRDGRAYLVYESSTSALVMEYTDTQAQPIISPMELRRIDTIHATGPEAPARSQSMYKAVRF